MNNELELIDFYKKGNSIRLYFGKNGEQKGDDWDDSPYDCNAGAVYPEHVNKELDIFVPIDFEVKEPADECINPPYCKNDFIHKKTWVLWVESEWGNGKIRTPVGIFFGDSEKEIKEKLLPYNALYLEVTEEE